MVLQSSRQNVHYHPNTMGSSDNYKEKYIWASKQAVHPNASNWNMHVIHCCILFLNCVMCVSTVWNKLKEMNKQFVFCDCIMINSRKYCTFKQLTNYSMCKTILDFHLNYVIQMSMQAVWGFFRFAHPPTGTFTVKIWFQMM